MTDRTISLRQMLAVVFLALFPLGTEVLFSRLSPAGAAGWLSLLAAGVVALLLAALVGRRSGVTVPLSLSREGVNRVLAGGFLLWGLLFGGAQVCRMGVRLSDSLGASPVLMSGLLMLLAAWMAAGGLPAFARACEIFLLAVGGAFALILLGGMFRLRWDWVLLWTSAELGQVPVGALESLGLLAVGCYGLFLLEHVTGEDRARPRLLWMIGRLFLLLAAAGVLILGRFGAPLTGQMNRPFFQMVSGLGLEGAFQRLEQLASALWVLGDLALLGFLLLCLVRLTAHAAGRQEKQGWAWLWGGVLFLLSLPVTFWQGVLAGPVLWVGNLAAGALILALSTRKKRK